MIKTKTGALSVMMLCFFTMGFADLVGIATNYVQQELSLNNSLGGTLVAMTFIWYLVLGVPTGLLMNRIGRKRTVLLAIGVTVLSLLLPCITLLPLQASACFAIYIASFCLLGIGNTLMQTSLNPLASNVVSPERFSSALAFGQFAKAIASFITPIIAMWGATSALPLLQPLGWKALYPLFGIVSLVVLVLLACTHIEEDIHPSTKKVLPEYKAAFGLLHSPYILLCFVGVMCTAGIDICTNSTAPKLLMERCGLPLEEAGFATSLYFIFRTIGCLSGSAILSRFSDKKYFFCCILLIIVGIALTAFVSSQWVLYLAFALIGLGNANTCIVIFTRALRFDPSHENELAGLMVTGLVGAMVFPLLSGLLSDAVALTGAWATLGAIAVMALAATYLLTFAKKL